MHPREIPPLEPGCPWFGWPLPDIKHCEENLCSWITAPANTWSNLAFIAVGLWLWSRPRQEQPGPVRWLGPVAVILGIVSFLFHASYTFFFQVFDFIGMFLFVLLLLFLNFGRLGWVSQKRFALGYTGAVLLSIGWFFAHRALGWPVQHVISIETALVLVTELIAWIKIQETRYRDFMWMLACMATALTFFMLDYTRVWCDPADHVWQGHALWHVFAALTFVAAARFYQQFYPSDSSV